MKLKKLIVIFIAVIFMPINIKANEYWDFEEDTLTIHQMNRDYINNPSLYWESYNNSIKKIVIEDGIDNIFHHLFANLPNLEEVIFPKSMGGEIDNYAFYNCPKLKEIKLPIGISRVGKYAFYGTGITKVTIPIYLGWIEENAFNEGTEIIKLADKEHIIAAGTAGPMKHLIVSNATSEGRAGSNTCYNKFYYGSFWDDTAYWKLYEDGTLIITGTELTDGYIGSRIPWGCYKNQIKRVIYNEDYVGKLTKRNKYNLKEALSNATYAIYVNKPVEEIMNNRIKTITSTQFWDCREDCIYGFRNLEEVIVNRGVEEIKSKAFNSQSIKRAPSNIYVSKHVKKIGNEQLSYTESNDNSEKTINLEVSYEDYKNNNYDYGELVNEEGFKEILEPTTSFYGPSNINNLIDNYYVSINDNSAPKTIKEKDKTLYLYETYITKDNGSVEVSIPKDESLEYYVKEIKAPVGFEVDPKAYRIDTSKKELNIEVADYPIKKKNIIKNPQTEATILILLLLTTLLSITHVIRKKVILINK